MKDAEIKKWLDNILEAWEDFKAIEGEAALDKIVEEICRLYTKKSLAQALLILRPLVKT